MTLYEQYLYHCRNWMSNYHLSFAEIENTDLTILLDLEVLDSRIDAAFNGRNNTPAFIDDILGL